MISYLFATFLVASPFPFEVGSGFTLEPFTSVTFQDKLDSTLYGGGVRLSHMHATASDAVITADLEARYGLTFSGTDKTPHHRYHGLAHVVAYEIFNPMALRVFAGGGVERREGEWNGEFSYGAGLGRFLASRFSIFADIAAETISRTEDSQPINVDLSLFWIF